MIEKIPYIARRIIAYLLDVALVYTTVVAILQGLLLRPIRESLGIYEEWFYDPWHLEGYILLTISLPVWIYFTSMESSRWQATLGKKYMKLKVSDIDGQAISRSKAFGRTILKLLPWELSHLGVVFPEPLYYSENGEVRWLTIAGMALVVIYFISIYFLKKTQTIYDLWLGTKVES
ncbi:MAG TPA: RDD family protein [Saprospiraceae bacterium]|nr:RDD family protein [Saprospiraceae bacterium]